MDARATTRSSSAARCSYEKIVHDTLLDNYGVFSFNGSKTGNAYADFLLGLPATMTQDAPVRKTDNGAYISLFAQDDYRVHPRVTLNLGVRYDLQFPFTDPDNRKLAFVPGAQSQVSPTALEGLLFPGRPGHQPRHRRDRHQQHRAARSASRGIPSGDGRMAIRAGAGVFYGSITGNEWNTTADNQPFTVRQSFPTVFTLSDPYGNLPGGVGAVPVHLRSGEPALHAAGAGLRSVARLRLALHVPDEPDDREGDPAQLQRERVVRRRARTQAAGEHRPELSGATDRAPRRPTSTRGGRTSRASSRRRASSSRSSTATTTRCSSAPSGAARASRPRRTTRSARRSRTSTIRAAGCRRCRTRTGSSSSADARRPIARTASCFSASGSSTTSPTRSRSSRRS